MGEAKYQNNEKNKVGAELLVMYSFFMQNFIIIFFSWIHRIAAVRRLHLPPTSSHSQVGGSSRTECASLGCTILVHPKMASIRGQINEPRDGHVAREVDSRAFSESSPFFRNQRTKLYPPIAAVDANKRYVRINVEMNVEISLLLSSARTLSE